MIAVLGKFLLPQHHFVILCAGVVHTFYQSIVSVYISFPEERNIMEISNIQLEHDSSLEDGFRSFIASLKSRKKQKHEDIFQRIRAINGVAYLEEL